MNEEFLSKEDDELFNFFEVKCGIKYSDEEKNEILDFFDFFNENNNVNLNLQQKKAILCNADVLQIVASAGAGKTATLVAKVNYLIHVKKVDPSKILCLSFSLKSVKDLRKKLRKSFTNKWITDLKEGRLNSFSDDFKDKEVKVSTFHSFGYSFLDKKVFNGFENEEEQNKAIKELFEDFILKEIYDNIAIFELFKLYFPEIFNHRNKRDPELKKDFKIKSKGAKKHYYYFESLKENCLLSSFTDLVIADFLILNDIDFEVEKIIPYENKEFKIDFFIPAANSKNGIYLDDHRLDENGISSDIKKDGDALIKFNQYISAINNIKDEILKDDLIILNSYKDYRYFRDFSAHKNFWNILTKELEDRGLILNPNKFDERQLKQRLTDLKFFEDLDGLIKIIIHFIELFKQHKFSIEDLKSFEGNGGREKFLLWIISKFYEKYQNHLKNEGLVDFNDMITESIPFIKSLDYDYILVDEYQDISKIRYELLDHIKKVSNAKLTVVGDDWQSIYGFTGCEIEYFKNFKINYFPNAKKITLDTTYRFSKELIDISSEFALYDSLLSKKYLKPNDLTENEKIKIDDEISYLKNLEEDLSEEIDENIKFLFDEDDSFKPIEILKYLKPNDQKKLVYTLLKSISFKVEKGLMKGNKILILSRYNYVLDEIEKDLNEHFNFNKYNVEVSYSTIHKAKGLESDNVILLDFNNKRKGIPSRINDVNILRFVSPGDSKEIRKERRYLEERRVFYVALTRTKNKIFLCTQYGKESDFYYDLLKIDRKKVKLRVFRPSKSYNPFMIQVGSFLKNYWDKKDKIKEIKTLDYYCPKCKNHKLKLYEIEDKRVIACPDLDFNEEKNCNFYVKKFIYNLGDLKIVKCPCRKGFLYSNKINFSAPKKRYCLSSSKCEFLKKQKEKEKEIILEKGQQKLI